MAIHGVVFGPGPAQSNTAAALQKSDCSPCYRVAGFNCLSHCQRWPSQESRPAPRKSTLSRIAPGLVRSTYGNGHHELHTSIPETEVEQQIRGAEESQAGPSDVEEQQEKEEEALTFRPDRIGFIGAGQMGEALICGFIRAGICSPSQLCASVRSEERRQRMLSLGLQVFGDATLGGSAELAAASDIIFLGVKPQYLDGVLEALAPHITPRHLVVSIAAGVRLASLEGRLPEGTRVIRVMPNTPCLIGQAASAYVLGNHATNDDATKIYMLLSSAGLAVSVEERMMDAVTGLSGSGPAYVFLAIEAMADGAVAAGLPRDKALALAAQTVSGAARMCGGVVWLSLSSHELLLGVHRGIQVLEATWKDVVLEGSGDGSLTHPALLKDRVTSPAGTTIVGLAELEASGLRGALIRAVQAAAKRSETLG